jgi:hypothetical protein
MATGKHEWYRCRWINGLLPVSIQSLSHDRTAWRSRSISDEVKRGVKISVQRGASIAHVSGAANHQDAVLSSMRGKHSEAGDGRARIIVSLEVSSSNGTKDDDIGRG